MTAPITADNFRDILYAPHLQASEKSSLISNKIGQSGSTLAYFDFKSQMNSRVEKMKKNLLSWVALSENMDELFERGRNANSGVTAEKLQDEFNAFSHRIGRAKEDLKKDYTDAENLANYFIITASAEKSLAFYDEAHVSSKQKDYLQSHGDKIFDAQDKLKELQADFDKRAFAILLARQEHEARTNFNQSAVAFSKGPGYEIAAPEKAAFRGRGQKLTT